ncbi:MAG: oxidoreductase [Thermoanaerobaculia bacterium]
MTPRTSFSFTGLFVAWVALASTGASAPGKTEENAQEISKAGPRLVFSQLGKDVSLRGLSVVDDRVVWVSGAAGTIALSTDGAKSFQFRNPPEFAARDFRDIEGFDERRAVALAVGAPARILASVDGGTSWRAVYRNERPESFLDGFDFWDERRGIAFGDPLDGRFLILTTADGGATWSELAAAERPAAFPGEAAFAASGTSIRVFPGGRVAFGTGGSRSRLWISEDYGAHWQSRAAPLRQGLESAGIFSLAGGGAAESEEWIAVGGDFKADRERREVAFVTRDRGDSWNPIVPPPAGFRSAVERLPVALGGGWIATGTSGTDQAATTGGGFRVLSVEGFHAVRAAKSGSLVVLVGAGGRLARLVLQP